MKIIKRATLAMLMITAALFSKGQQDPMYTQYIFNLQTVNPAYAGSWQTIGFMALSRFQWVGLNGHPTTQTFSFQTPLKKENVGIGLNVVNDQLGFEKRFSVNLDYSYLIHLSDITSLRFGIKGGFTNYSNNLLEYQQYPDNLSDPAFQSVISNKFMPNVGLGLFLSSPMYYLSLSLPKIFESSYVSNINNFSLNSEVRHLYFAGGMIVDLSESVKFKPTFMTKMVRGAPFQYDLSANVLLVEKFWLGAMYRSGDAVGAIAQWVVNRNFRLGYSYDFTTSDLKNYHYGTHEVMISYEFVLTNRKLISPRYF